MTQLIDMCYVSRKTQIQIPSSYWTIDLSWGGSQTGVQVCWQTLFKRKEGGKGERGGPKVDLFCLCTHSFMMEGLGSGTLFYEAQGYALCKGDLGEKGKNMLKVSE